MTISVLGVDAAWTVGEPSGVALVCGQPGHWRLTAVAPSYNAFIALSEDHPVNWHEPSFKGHVPDTVRLLRAAEGLGSERVSVVAIDMPVAVRPFTGRRAADREVSRLYGARKCSTHSPTEARPGKLGQMLSLQLAAEGYPIAPAYEKAGEVPRTIEVYPHPALLHLLQRPQRVPYKVSKSGKYWPGASSEERRGRLIDEFNAIKTGLSAAIMGVEEGLSLPLKVDTLAALKRYEDCLDAIVCAWVGTSYLEGRAVGYGDADCAIWIPGSSVRQ